MYDRVLAEEKAGAEAANVELVNGWVYRLLPVGINGAKLWQRVGITEYNANTGGWHTLVDDRASPVSNEWVTYLVNYSPTGEKAFVVYYSRRNQRKILTREYDLARSRFVEDGFSVELEGATIGWVDDKTAYYVSLANSFDNVKLRPPTAYVWHRGDRHAAPLYQGSNTTSTITVQRLPAKAGPETWLIGDHSDRGTVEYKLTCRGRSVPLALPKMDLSIATIRGFLVFKIPAAWTLGATTWQAGSVLAVDISDLELPILPVETVWRPSSSQSASELVRMENNLLLTGVDNVQGRAWLIERRGQRWRTRVVAGLPKIGALRNAQGDAHGLVSESITRPPVLFRVDARSAQATLAAPYSKANGASKPYSETQMWATSQDGTPVPYTLVRARSTPLSQNLPLIVQGYGAYGDIQLPIYGIASRTAWLDQGGAFVLANIRGGGEFAGWHVTGAQRARVYEDFAAVLQDLTRRGISSPRRLGIIGQSAGGALIGYMLTHSSGLFSAGVAENGLFDFSRFNETETGEAGQSSEWGSPNNPAERAFLEESSPILGLSKGRNTATALITTATSDTRVMPAQSRRFYWAARNAGRDVYYYEHEDGGHGRGTTPEQRAETSTVIYSFFRKLLMLSK